MDLTVEAMMLYSIASYLDKEERHEPDVVVNCAALSVPRACETNPRVVIISSIPSIQNKNSSDDFAKQRDDDDSPDVVNRPLEPLW
ncbi:hypothetical protein L1987_08747 [Smallanthus sonchifolius]|uniref:Uncharacterized protein n=1 Tax=Smallanthus sonchifolius TaxID=185202 RepID=A0ACB9JML9_9ASTR|nr:hypothetical protein L1987_08747 [Smallanthus sonchifolius]